MFRRTREQCHLWQCFFPFFAIFVLPVVLGGILLSIASRIYLQGTVPASTIAGHKCRSSQTLPGGNTYSGEVATLCWGTVAVGPGDRRLPV